MRVYWNGWAIVLWLSLGGCLQDPSYEDHSSQSDLLGLTSWPADGTQNVPLNLRFVALRFDEPVSDSGILVLYDETSQQEMPLQPLSAPCHAIGWSTGHCMLAKPVNDLLPHTAYRLSWQSSTASETSPLKSWQTIFHTGASHDKAAPHWQPETCAMDEHALDVGCLLLSDHDLALRVFSDEPIRLWLETDYGATQVLAPRGIASLHLTALPADSQIPVMLTAADAADNVSRIDFVVHTEKDLPMLSITKVLANPRGKEPQQEFIEIHNFGSIPIELLGFQVSDRSDHPGDIIAQTSTLSAGARALVVSSHFDTTATDDGVIPEGLPLIRVDESLGSGGLANSGEPLFLRDSQGRRLSAVPAVSAPKPGVCLFRSGQDPRSDSLEHFSYEPLWDCAPGHPVPPPHD